MHEVALSFGDFVDVSNFTGDVTLDADGAAASFTADVSLAVPGLITADVNGISVDIDTHPNTGPYLRVEVPIDQAGAVTVGNNLGQLWGSSCSSTTRTARSSA